jgi:hypothetical protein
MQLKFFIDTDIPPSEKLAATYEIPEPLGILPRIKFSEIIRRRSGHM